MPITIGSNISSLRTVRTLDRTSSDLSNVFQRLSSGQRITRASDDAAGLSIASALNVKSQVFAQGIRNVNDGISLMAIAEGALGTLSDIVTRVGELPEQAANGTFSARQRVALDREADTLLREYNRIIQSTTFNGMKILDGSEDVVTLQHGIGDEMVTRLEVGYQLGNAAGDGTFGVAVTLLSGYSSGALALGDVNSDGIIDVISGDGGSNTLSVFIGNGNGSFKARRSFQAGAHDISLADMNGDGTVDLVTTSSSSTTGILLGNGDGTFKAQSSFAPGILLTDTSVADFNGDGVMDIVRNDLNANVATVLIGNGNGTFAAPSSFGVGSFAFANTIGDINGDGILDIVTAEFASKGVSLLIGNGNGTFRARVSIATDPYPYSVSLGDLNSDGALDIVVVGEDSFSATILIGNGNGTFKGRTSVVTGTDSSQVTLGDVNGDGMLDMLTADPL